MKSTQLGTETVAQKLFNLTESLIKEGLRESKNYPEWRGAAVNATVINLIEVFNKEKAEFATLQQYLDDIPVGVLAFKETEAKLLSWKSVTSSSRSWLASGWWGSDVASRLNSVSQALAEDKKALLKLWKNTES